MATDISDSGHGVRLHSNAVTASATLAAVLLASAILPLPDRTGRILGMPSVCVFYELTGLPCPACGMTRSFVCFAHGHVVDAFHWNLLGPPLWLILAFLLIRSLLTLTLRRPILPLQPTTINRLSWGGITALVVFGVTRIILLTIEHQKFGISSVRPHESLLFKFGV